MIRWIRLIAPIVKTAGHLTMLNSPKQAGDKANLPEVITVYPPCKNWQIERLLKKNNIKVYTQFRHTSAFWSHKFSTFHVERSQLNSAMNILIFSGYDAIQGYHPTK